jgi:hypothetical protein
MESYSTTMHRDAAQITTRLVSAHVSDVIATMQYMLCYILLVSPMRKMYQRIELS